MDHHGDDRARAQAHERYEDADAAWASEEEISERDKAEVDQAWEEWWEYVSLHSPEREIGT